MNKVIKVRRLSRFGLVMEHRQQGNDHVFLFLWHHSILQDQGRKSEYAETFNVIVTNAMTCN